MYQDEFSPDRRRLQIAVGSLLLLTLALKIFLASRLELYSDEIFYWFASTRPALAYSDLPFMASLLAGRGAALFGEHALAVRSLFLLLGSSIPLLVYWLARPLVGANQALMAALLTLCLPLGAFLGLLAVPDVPLAFLGLLMMGLAERATRLDTTPWWIALGVATALGLSTHYRFILFPAALCCFLLLSAGHRHLWLSGRLWLAVVIATIGLLPALLFNLQHELSALDYHLVERHPWQFQVQGLAHPFIQALVVTPPLYLLLLATLIHALREARRGNHRAGLLAAFALTHLAVYLLTAPWADSTRTTVHWPLPGYLPLLVLAPQMLLRLEGRLRQWLGNRRARLTAIAVPLCGLLGGMLTFAGIGSQGFNEQLQQWLGPDVLSNKMAGWQPLHSHLHTQWPQYSHADDNSLIITDNYYTAAQIAFHTGRRQGLYTLDADKAVRDGRLQQLAIWQMNADALAQRNQAWLGLFITEDSTLNVDEKKIVLQRACEQFDALHYREQLFLLNGEKTFSLYEASVGNSGLQAVDCPLPAMAWLDEPAADGQVQGPVTVSGWAYQQGQGIEQIRLLVNREPVLTLTRDIARADVVAIRAAHGDPDAPLLGFSGELESSQLPAGPSSWQLEVTSRHGERQLFPPRRILINH